MNSDMTLEDLLIAKAEAEAEITKILNDLVTLSPMREIEVYIDNTSMTCVNGEKILGVGARIEITL